MKNTIAFVTYRDRAALTDDDALAATAVREVTGIAVEPLPWDAPGVAWEQFKAVVLRATWDYFRRAEEFGRWLEKLERIQARVLNPLALVRWNAEKTYLRELEAVGLPIVPTVWAMRGEQFDLGATLQRQGWRKAVVKPTISGSAYETWICSLDSGIDALEQVRLDRLLRCSGVMVQPYLEEIVTCGEWSLIFFAGEFSHAILKKPRPGDFRVQEQFGGAWKAVQPSSSLVAQATRAIAATISLLGSPTPLYARVDGVETTDGGGFLLMELELIEPVLTFAASPKLAPFLFARALADRL